MKIIFIVHNQLELVKQELQVILEFAQVEKDNIIIVDNYSDDGMREWLEEQTGWNYLVSDEKIESYAKLINAAICEFDIKEDVLLLAPNCIVLPGALQEMQRVLYSSEKIGAVSPSMIFQGTEEGRDYEAAVNYAQRCDEGERRKNKQLAGLMVGAALIKGQMLLELEKFDERLILPDSNMVDYTFRGILQGYEMWECGNAFFYNLGQMNDGYANAYKHDVDRDILKEKWGMNYFNNYPNEDLIKYIQREEYEKFQVLEVGSDCGANLLGIKNRYPNAELYGVELNPYAAEIASHFVTVEVGNIEDKKVGFRDVKFDYILFGDVLEHLRDPESTLEYCRSLLKEDGKVIACIPNLMHYSVLYDLINGKFTYADMGLLDKTHIHFFTYYEIMEMFQRAGFVVEAATSKNVGESSEAEEFIEQLLAISSSAEKHMFTTFQYVVMAGMQKNH